MSKIKKSLWLFLILLIIGGIWFYRNWRQEEFMPPKENTILINLKNENGPLFFRAKVWGVAGNHEEIVLSRSENSPPDKANDYIFYTSEIFYKVKGDSSVFVYAAESSTNEPINRISNIIIKGLKTADEIKNYSINYKRYGLQRISIYEQ